MMAWIAFLSRFNDSRFLDYGTVDPEETLSHEEDVSLKYRFMFVVVKVKLLLSPYSEDCSAPSLPMLSSSTIYFSTKKQKIRSWGRFGMYSPVAISLLHAAHS